MPFSSQRIRKLTAFLSARVTSFKSMTRRRDVDSNSNSRCNSVTSSDSIRPLKVNTTLPFADRWIFSISSLLYDHLYAYPCISATSHKQLKNKLLATCFSRWSRIRGFFAKLVREFYWQIGRE